jgi:glutathione synthase/RimK-type ligase-like ATP-grasp enzyme
MKNVILIIGDKYDPHVMEVVKKIDTENYRVFYLNPLDGSLGKISFYYDPFRIEIANAHHSVTLNEIITVWWRLKPDFSKLPKDLEEVTSKNFIQREWTLLLETLSFYLDDCFWMNKRGVDHLLRSKPFQLHQAQSFGFKIPGTIISNNFDAIADHFSTYKEILYKPLSYFVSPPKKILYANSVSVEDLPLHEENISVAPCIFQQYIDKKYELRITVVGEEIFPVKIYSQENPNAKLDWRREQLYLQYELVTLDTALEKKIRTFHQAMGLAYGAYDFIAGNDGTYTFLEVNPVGQWLWLESLLKLDISKSVAQLLMRH